MKPSESLKTALEPLLRKVELGTKDYPRQESRLDVAQQRALDRAGGGQLPSDGIRGGTVNPTDADDRKEADRVKRQAEKDAWDIGTITARMVSDARSLARITDRQAEVIHDSKRPLNALPGCRSCARKEDDGGVTIGGHWAAVYEKSLSSGLCRDCWDFRSATGGVPPIKWCHKMHVEGKKSANRWLATEFPKLMESVQRTVRAASGITAEDLELRAESIIVAEAS